MCGLFGFVTAFGRPLAPALAALRQLRHRGPDDAGLVWQVTPGGKTGHLRAELASAGWTLPEGPGGQATAGLGHTRFSLVDLSRGGAQPMLSGDGRFAVVFNGEIYNHAALRAELQGLGHVFRSRSDTEVLLAGFAQWGTECFTRFSGWWAVALLELATGRVLLSRDRLGKAPLYLVQAPTGVHWASEIPTLLALSGHGAAANQPAIDRFVLRGLRDLGDETTFQGVRSFPRASYAWVTPHGVLEQPQIFWALPTSRLTEGDIGVADAVGRVRDLLVDATALRMDADVPVALQLSGGLDSSVALACAALSGRKIHTVTVSFPEAAANEDQYARLAASQFPGQVEHEFIAPAGEIGPEALLAFSEVMAEPYHSPNQLANNVIWRRLLSAGYRAVIYGAGGDEVFAGYYAQYFVPHVRAAIARGDFAAAMRDLTRLSERDPNGADLLGRAAALLPGALPAYDALRRGAPPALSLYHRTTRAPLPTIPAAEDQRLLALMGDMRMNYWLRIDNQNSMSIPVELRSPFLDHRVVELAFTLPTSYLIRDGWMKWIVRKAFEGVLPAEVIWRRQKMGFPFPLASWLDRNAAWARSQLLESGAPGVNAWAVRRGFEFNVRRNPDLTWRTLSYALWWRKMIAEPSRVLAA